MSPDYKNLVHGWLKGHQQACAFIETVFAVLHTCDDLIDRDKAVSAMQIQQSYWMALIDLPRNPFYVEQFPLLNGALQLAFLNWQIANQMEVSESTNSKPIAFVLRSSYVDLITLCAWILGGADWARQVGYAARLQASGEGMERYLHNLRQEHRQLVEG